MYIKNRKSLFFLATNEKEKRSISILVDAAEETLRISQPASFMDKTVRFTEELLIVEDKEIKITHFSNFYLIAFGKAAQTMTLWMTNNFPKPFSQIILSSPDGCDERVKNLPNCRFYQGGHPYPNEQSLLAAKEVIALLKKMNTTDLCFILVSGGGSALLDLPAFDISLSDYLQLMQLLLSCGATINEINTIRKHFSEIKGGRLAQQTKATLVTLIISDVPGNDPSIVASGPTVPDSSTWEDCKKIIVKYDLERALPSSIKTILQKGEELKKYETPSKKDQFKHVTNFIIGNNEKVLTYLKDFFEKNHNIQTIIGDSRLEGEASEVAKKLLKYAIKRLKNEKDIKRTCILFGGETTVTLPENLNIVGKGGRNQELALSFALANENNKNLFLLQLGTDGIDGNSRAAGALIGPFTLHGKERIKEARNALDMHNSNGFFKKFGGEIITGYTGTNVMDVGMLLIEK
ncbi:MAG: glycerate kinase type-2 family protein [Candidatus Heimdallarchaeaceae archaeon]